MARGRPPRILLAQPAIRRFFEASPQRIFTRADLAAILKEQRENWQLAALTGVEQFISFLNDHAELRTVQLTPDSGHPNVRTLTRYHRDQFFPAQLVQTVHLHIMKRFCFNGQKRSRLALEHSHSATNQLPQLPLEDL